MNKCEGCGVDVEEGDDDLCDYCFDFHINDTCLSSSEMLEIWDLGGQVMTPYGPLARNKRHWEFIMGRSFDLTD